MSEQSAYPQYTKEITDAVREADDWFIKSGGSSRHWVVECFIPALLKRGLVIIDHKKLPESIAFEMNPEIDE